jgi:hypothetical protein
VSSSENVNYLYALPGESLRVTITGNSYDTTIRYFSLAFFNMDNTVPTPSPPCPCPQNIRFGGSNYYSGCDPASPSPNCQFSDSNGDGKIDSASQRSKRFSPFCSNLYAIG